MIRRLQMSTSVFFKYFKAELEGSEQMFINQKTLLLLKKETKRMSL